MDLLLRVCGLLGDAPVVWIPNICSHVAVLSVVLSAVVCRSTLHLMVGQINSSSNLHFHPPPSFHIDYIDTQTLLFLLFLAMTPYCLISYALVDVVTSYDGETRYSRATPRLSHLSLTLTVN